MTDKPLVLVTGASGYIGMHIILQLLKQGYRVRGTLRSLKKETRLRKIFAEYVSADDKLELVVADLLSDDGWDDAMQDCTYVMHVASPVIIGEPKDEAEAIRPAIEGTQRVLEAAEKANIKRFVQTSSFSAIGDESQNRGSKVWTEDDWADPTKDIGAYRKSKTLAEKIVWEFAEKHPEMECVAINPVFVIGPVFDDTFSPSIDIVRKLLNKDYPGVPRLGFSMVDVRDVASAHIIAMTHPDAPGKRFCCATDFLWMKDIANILNSNFEAQGYKVPTLGLPDFLIRIVAIFDKSMGSVVGSLNIKTDASNKRLKEMLDWQPLSIEQSVIDTGKSLIEKGIV